MDILNIISVVTALLTTIAAILAWIAKIRWSNEYSKAKDEIIRAKEAQIDELESHLRLLSDMNPVKIREYYLSMKAQMEEYNELITGQLAEAKLEIAGKEAALVALREAGEARETEVAQLNSERDHLQSLTARMETELFDLRKRTDSQAQFLSSVRDSFKNLVFLSTALSKVSSTDQSDVAKRRRELEDEMKTFWPLSERDVFTVTFPVGVPAKKLTPEDLRRRKETGGSSEDAKHEKPG